MYVCSREDWPSFKQFVEKVFLNLATDFFSGMLFKLAPCE